MDCNKAVPTMEGRDRNEEATVQRQNTNEAEEEENSTVANEMDTNQKFEVEYQVGCLKESFNIPSKLCAVAYTASCHP